MAATDLLSALLVIAGGFFLIVGGLGFMFLADLGSVTVKLALVLLFLLLTGPVATHALAKAALHGGLRPIAAELPAPGSPSEVDPPWNT